MPNLTDFSTLTFDCYGTLIDWESGIWDALQPVIMRSGRSDITRADGLVAFARFETEQETKTPDLLYPDLLTVVHGEVARHFDLSTTTELNEAFGSSVKNWPAFPDSADALRRLKKHFKLVILSNVNRDGFALSNQKLGVEFDAIYTAQDVGTYKPSHKNFDYMLEHLKNDLGVSKNEVLHTAQSLHHDHLPAHQLGFRRAWIDRQRLSEGGSLGATAAIADDLPAPDFLYFTMMEMAEARDGA